MCIVDGWSTASSWNTSEAVTVLPPYQIKPPSDWSTPPKKKKPVARKEKFAKVLTTRALSCYIPVRRARMFAFLVCSGCCWRYDGTFTNINWSNITMKCKLAEPASIGDVFQADESILKTKHAPHKTLSFDCWEKVGMLSHFQRNCFANKQQMVYP